MIKKIIFAAVTFGMVLAVSCNNEEKIVSKKNMLLNIKGLKALGKDYVYEGWIIVDGKPVSTGKFTKVVFPQSFTVDAKKLANAKSFVLSIEPAKDQDPAPSKTKILKGDFKGNNALLKTSIIGDFLSSKGTFFFRTPTDEKSGKNNNNDQYGVWFKELKLPTLPTGWVYEGWVVGDSLPPLSTGTFTAFNVADNNSGKPTSFSSNISKGPNFPGEDFFKNAPKGVKFPLNVSNKAIVISVEPFPDDSPEPFSIKPLSSEATKSDRKLYPETHEFKLNLHSLPMGSVTISK